MNLVCSSLAAALAGVIPAGCVSSSSAARATCDQDGSSAGYPSGQATRSLYDDTDYQRAAQAYLRATQLVNSVAIKKALVDAGVSPTEPTLLVMDQHVGPN